MDGINETSGIHGRVIDIVVICSRIIFDMKDGKLGCSVKFGLAT